MTLSAATEAVGSFSRCRVHVIGDLMLDEYVWGTVRRISPEAPVPVLDVSRRSYSAGGAANTAANVVSLSGTVALCGVVGEDEQALLLDGALSEAGIQERALHRHSGRPTTTKTRLVAQHQQVARMDVEVRTPVDHEMEDQLLAWVQAAGARRDALVLSDYAKGVVTPRLAASCLAAAHAAGQPSVVDPKGSDFAKYRGATVITPNTHELEVAVGREVDTEDKLAHAAEQVLDSLGGTALLVTRGAQGMTLYRLGQPPAHFAATARNVYDVTGAGDTVVGTLALALAAGLRLDAAVWLANRAAGVVVGRLGTHALRPDELLAAIAEPPIDLALASPSCT